jgi:hypothetical protein
MKPHSRTDEKTNVVDIQPKLIAAAVEPAVTKAIAPILAIAKETLESNRALISFAGQLNENLGRRARH